MTTDSVTKITATVVASRNLRDVIYSGIDDGELNLSAIADAYKKVPAASRAGVQTDILRGIMVHEDPAVNAHAVALVTLFDEYDRHTTTTTRIAPTWPEASAMQNVADRFAFYDDVLSAVRSAMCDTIDALGIAEDGETYTAIMDRIVNLADRTTADYSAVTKVLAAVDRGAPRERGNGNRVTHEVDVEDLLIDGAVEDGEALFGPADRGIVGRLHADGDAESGYRVTVRFVRDGVTMTEDHASLSAAAAAVVAPKKGPNGWDWFRVERDGNMVRLSAIRATVAAATMGDTADTATDDDDDAEVSDDE